MTSEEVANLILIEDSNKGFENAIKRGWFELAEIYLIDIVERTKKLINHNQELKCLEYSSFIEYTCIGGNTIVINLTIYNDFKSFFSEFNDLIESITN